MNRGDFSRVYSDHKELVWRLVSRYVSQRADKEDIFQEVFLNIHRSLSKFRGDSSMETWIFRITANVSINYLKKKNRYRKFREILAAFRPELPEEKDPDDKAENIMKPLEKLNPRQKMILLLSDVEEKKLNEIAEIMKLPAGTVKSNLHRAREIVKKEVMKNGRI